MVLVSKTRVVVIGQAGEYEDGLEEITGGWVNFEVEEGVLIGGIEAAKKKWPGVEERVDMSSSAKVVAVNFEQVGIESGVVMKVARLNCGSDEGVFRNVGGLML